MIVWFIQLTFNDYLQVRALQILISLQFTRNGSILASTIYFSKIHLVKYVMNKILKYNEPPMNQTNRK